MGKTGKVKKAALFRKMLRKDFLVGVRGRLENDAGAYFESIERIRRSTGTGVGFWALVRMILPAIEAVARVIYRRSRRASAKPQRLLQEIGIAYPHLAWEMFRHSLVHTDDLRPAVYRNQIVEWEVRVGGGHGDRRNRVAIDMRQLYTDFLRFLDREIQRSGTRMVYVERAVRFGRGVDPLLKGEFKKIRRQ